MTQTRRQFLTTLSLAGTASLAELGLGRKSLAAEPPLEVTTIRFAKDPATCIAPQHVAAELLRAEGFTDIRVVDVPRGNLAAELLARGDTDLMVGYASNFILDLDKGEASTLLAGVHVGCFVLFGHEDVHGIAGLKGKTVGVPGFGYGPHLLLTLMAAEVGARPQEGHSLDRRSCGEAERFVH
jgi:NitT/TauT family transport system substrate-binding protein